MMTFFFEIWPVLFKPSLQVKLLAKYLANINNLFLTSCRHGGQMSDYGATQGVDRRHIACLLLQLLTYGREREK